MVTLRSNIKPQIFAGVVSDQKQALIRALINFLRLNGAEYSPVIIVTKKYTSYKVDKKARKAERQCLEPPHKALLQE